jgi:hypothetical protein
VRIPAREEKLAVQTESWAMGTYVMFTRLSHDALRAANAPEEFYRVVMERVHGNART